MYLWLSLLGALQLIISLLLLIGVWRFRIRLQALQLRIAAVPTLPPVAPTRARISIEILNPLALALRETRLAGALFQLAPELIERIVYRRTAEALTLQLREQGVDAQVDLHDLD